MAILIIYESINWLLLLNISIHLFLTPLLRSSSRNLINNLLNFHRIFKALIFQFKLALFLVIQKLAGFVILIHCFGLISFEPVFQFHSSLLTVFMCIENKNTVFLHQYVHCSSSLIKLLENHLELMLFDYYCHTHAFVFQ